MDEFIPLNAVQFFAMTKRGIKSQSEFERGIGGKPWKVARVTARSWWVSGLPRNMYLSSAAMLADYLQVSIDDLVNWNIGKVVRVRNGNSTK